MTSRDRLKRVPGLVPIVRTARRAAPPAARARRRIAYARHRARRSEQIAAYLRTHEVRRLQLGTGNNPYDGWLNTDVADFTRRDDVVYMDATKPFPLPDGSFEVVFSEHMLEHVTYAEGQHVLRECRRILRPNGRIRIATPGIDNLILLYGDDLTDLQRRYIRWSIETFIPDADAELPGFVLNNMLQNFAHRFVYDRTTLRHALERGGFVDAEECSVGESRDPELRGRERHMRRAAEFNAYETIVFEARRP